MRHLEAIPKHEMVARWLKTEIHSVRFEGEILELMAREGWDRRIIEEVERGAVFPELILVGTDEASPLTVLEVHARLTAYCLALEAVTEPLTAIVGFGPGMERV